MISGTVQFGMGETADKSKAQALAAGGFFAMPPGMQHFVSVDEETVVQLNGTGPSQISADDLRLRMGVRRNLIAP